MITPVIELTVGGMTCASCVARIEKRLNRLDVVGSDLALARLRLGDPIACVELLHDSVDITAGSGGRVAAQQIRLARRQLRPWRSHQVVADLDDQIHEALIGR